MNDQNKEDSRIGVTSKNGDHVEQKTPAPTPKKSWWERLSPEVQVIATIAAGLTGFVVACVAAGAAADILREASHRKTLNSDGHKAELERGIWDPVPPPKTLEEASARMILDHGKQQIVFIDDGDMIQRAA